MLLALTVIESERARAQMEREAITDAEHRVLERVRADRG